MEQAAAQQENSLQKRKIKLTIFVKNVDFVVCKIRKSCNSYIIEQVSERRLKQKLYSKRANCDF